MVDPDHEPPPTPVVMGRMQRDAFDRAVDQTVTEWVEALSIQSASDTLIGSLWLWQRQATEVEMAAVQRFREQGWSVLIRPERTLFMRYLRLSFGPAVPFPVNVPMPEGVVPPRSAEPPSSGSYNPPMTDPGSVIPPGPGEVVAVQQRKFEAAVQKTVTAWIEQLEGQSFADYSWGKIDGLNSPLLATEEEALKRFENAGWSIERKRYLAALPLFLPFTRLTFGSKPHLA